MKKLQVNKKFSKTILACGAHLKGSFCIGRGNYIYCSDPLDSLEDLEGFLEYERQVKRAIDKLKVKPQVVAADMHPDYLSRKFANDYCKKMKLTNEPVLVQHHHAHITGCMADNGVSKKVIGVAFDGTGLGTDGNIWGGEFLIADYSGFTRAAHLEYIQMPGGQMAIRQPWRMAAVYLHKAYGNKFLNLKLELIKKIKKSQWNILAGMLKNNINSPITSSAGRLFDAVSGILGLCYRIEYEAQAAIELEGIADKACKDEYKFDILDGNNSLIINTKRIILAIVRDKVNNKPVSVISAKFHNTLAEIIRATCQKIRKKTKVNTVALSGGVFQNKLLLNKTCEKLKSSDFKILLHKHVPTNDAGISLGQTVIAMKGLK